jgi:outer membrane protein TolC
MNGPLVISSGGASSPLKVIIPAQGGPCTSSQPPHPTAFRAIETKGYLLWLSLAFVLATSAPAATQTSDSTPFAMPASHAPWNAYRAVSVPEPSLANSDRLHQLMHDGKLLLTLQDAIRLALENNLDLAIARYNLPIAASDILRTRAGGFFRGVNAGVVQGTPGGGVGGIGSSSSGAGAGGTSSGAGGAGSGASGLVQSTLGIGTPVSSYDPLISASGGIEHDTLPQANLQLYGVPALTQNTGQVNFKFSQIFPTGTSLSVEFDNNRQTTNSIYTSLSPVVNSMYRVSFEQQLLAGFGFGPNLRYLQIAKNDRKITDDAFRNQVIATITQIENIYWDLVNANEQVRVNEQSLAFAEQSFDNTRKQLDLASVPAMDVMRAQAEVSRRKQNVTLARTNLELQELLLKNALTKNLDDPDVETSPIVPVETPSHRDDEALDPIGVLVSQSLRNRPELAESDADLENREITRKTARNALLPTLSLQAFYGGTGLAGLLNAADLTANVSSVPTDLSGAMRSAFNNSSPTYYVGLNLEIPLRNRVAKADQYRSELEYRQAGLRKEQLKNQIRIEVRNARYALEQCQARVAAARTGRDLAEKTFDITKKEQELGSGSSYQSLAAQRDLALAELDLVDATSSQAKAWVELDRATGLTLEHTGVRIQDAISGILAGNSLVSQERRR